MTPGPGTGRAVDAGARRDLIMRRLQETGFLSVSHLTATLGVSDMTVRRDLRRLAESGEVRVVHGGVSLTHGTLRTADFTSRGGRESAAKRSIARVAARLVGSASTIAIDAGTTPFALAAALPEQFGGTVITHSVPVMQQMLHMPTARVIGLGGELLADSQALVGSLTIRALAGLHAEVVFLGAAAVNRRGLFIATDLERLTKQALIDIADRVVLLADHSKFDAAAPVLLTALDHLDVLVTDAPLGPTLKRACDAAGVEVMTPQEQGG